MPHNLYAKQIIRRTLFVILLIQMFSFHLHSYSKNDILQKKISIEILKNELSKKNKIIPFPDYSNRSEWEKIFGDRANEYIQLGESKLDYQWKVITATDYLDFERSGNFKNMEDKFNDNATAYLYLFMAELAEGKGRFIDQLVNGSFYYCEMTTWVYAPHTYTQSSGRSLPDYRENLIDLTVGDIGAILSWSNYFFKNQFDKIDPAISLRIKSEIKRRIIDVYKKERSYWWMGFNYKDGDIINNWNPWCNLNILQVLLLNEQDINTESELIHKTIESVDVFLNFVSPDGACTEGPSYWKHSAGKVYEYLQLLSWITNNQYGLDKIPLIKRMGEYIVNAYIDNEWIVNFADASPKASGIELPLIFLYGKFIDSKMMVDYSLYRLSNFKQTIKPLFGRELFRTLQYLCNRNEYTNVKCMKYTPKTNVWYENAQLCFMRNRNFFIGIKGGNNDESHNHNDVGNAVVYYNGKPVFIDVGVGTYTKQTFSPQRYSIWTMQSQYHNLPLINGEGELNGRKYMATDIDFKPKQNAISMNIASAYPEGAKAKKWTRSYKLSNNSVVISDNYELNQSIKPNELHFMSTNPISISSDNDVFIQIDNEKVKIVFDKSKLTPIVERVNIEDKKIVRIWNNSLYRLIFRANNLKTRDSYSITIKK